VNYTKMAFLRRGLNSYVNLLNAHPLKMQMLTGSCLAYIGDGVAQMVIEQREKYDFVRGTRMAGFTLLIWAPLANRWMIFAERKFAGNSVTNLTKKVGIDQFMLGPALTTTFFCYNELLLGEGVDGAKKKIEHHLVGTQIAAWCVWIPAQYVNFFFMPLHMRVIFVQFIALFWNTYMAWKVMLRVE